MSILGVQLHHLPVQNLCLRTIISGQIICTEYFVLQTFNHTLDSECLTERYISRSLFACQVIAEQTSRQCVQRLPCVRCGVATHKSTPHRRNWCLMSTPSLSQAKTLCQPCPRWCLLPRGINKITVLM